MLAPCGHASGFIRIGPACYRLLSCLAIASIFVPAIIAPPQSIFFASFFRVLALFTSGAFGSFFLALPQLPPAVAAFHPLHFFSLPSFFRPALSPPCLSSKSPLILLYAGLYYCTSSPLVLCRSEFLSVFFRLFPFCFFVFFHPPRVRLLSHFTLVVLFSPCCSFVVGPCSPRPLGCSSYIAISASPISISPGRLPFRCCFCFIVLLPFHAQLFSLPASALTWCPFWVHRYFSRCPQHLTFLWSAYRPFGVSAPITAFHSLMRY